MNNSENISVLDTLFVYSKSGKVRVLNLENAKKTEVNLIADGWKHTATLDPRRFIEHLANSSVNEILSTIKGLRA